MFELLIQDAKRYVVPRRKFSNVISYYFAGILILLISEGFIATVIHRLSFALVKHHLRPIAFIISKFGLFFTGIYIHPCTIIGGGVKLNHSGTTIRAKSIGKNVEFVGSITVGERDAYSDNVPAIGDNVYVGAGARIFANIGNNVKVGANAVVINNVEDDSTCVGIPAKVISRSRV